MEKNPWIDYLDDTGWHKCQPDGILWIGNEPFILEMKLRQNWQGYEELRWLYIPVMEQYLRQRVRGLLVCNSLESKMQGWLFFGPQAAVTEMPNGNIGTWFFRA